MKNVVINGMGVLGRELFRYIFLNEITLDLSVAAINDPNISGANLAYLLKHDSVYGEFEPEVSYDGENIVVDGITIPFFKETVAENAAWTKYNIDVLLECTGVYTTRENADKLISSSGAKNVILCYLSDNVTPLIVPGVNAGAVDKVMSAGNAEIQAISSVMQAINKSYTIESAVIDIFTAYTNAQNTIDSFNDSDFAAGRAGAWNISPIKYKAVNKKIGAVMPVLSGKTIVNCCRAPVIAGGIANLIMRLSKSPTTDELASTLKYVSNVVYTEDPIVSSDAVGQYKPQLAAQYTQANGTTYSVTILYDNIRSFVNAICEIANLT